MFSCSTPGEEGGALLCPFLEPGTWPSGPAGREDGVAAVQARSGRTIEEGEADAVARKLPRPAAVGESKGTAGHSGDQASRIYAPVAPLVSQKNLWRCCIVNFSTCAQDMAKRPRRNRSSLALRAAFQETIITPANLVLPLFIHEGWCTRHEMLVLSVNSFMLFPKVPDALKVSGEYSRIKAGGVLKMVDEEKVTTDDGFAPCLQRAGAGIVVTYFIRQHATIQPILSADRIDPPNISNAARYQKDNKRHCAAEVPDLELVPKLVCLAPSNVPDHPCPRTQPTNQEGKRVISFQR
ncbi:hypothetical protein ABZP36_032946 [Zizania latifolia]